MNGRDLKKLKARLRELEEQEASKRPPRRHLWTSWRDIIAELEDMADWREMAVDPERSSSEAWEYTRQYRGAGGKKAIARHLRRLHQLREEPPLVDRLCNALLGKGWEREDNEGKETIWQHGIETSTAS